MAQRFAQGTCCGGAVGLVVDLPAFLELKVLIAQA